MDKMDHPYVMYKDVIVTPWDVCLILLSQELVEPLVEPQVGRTCPHCGSAID